MGVDQTFPSERVGRVLGQLQAEVENFVLKMAAQFQQRREQLIFLINNYDMMLAVLVVRSGQSSVVPAPSGDYIIMSLGAKTDVHTYI